MIYGSAAAPDRDGLLLCASASRLTSSTTRVSIATICRLAAEAGFECVELFALRSHFDYASPAAAASLAEWLRLTGLALHSVHAPIADTLVNGSVGAAVVHCGERQPTPC